jgi:hypothetical protein
MELDKVLNDLLEQNQNLQPPKPQEGHGIEIEQDQQTGQKLLHYFLIRNGKREYLHKKGYPKDHKGPQEFWQSLDPKYTRLFGTAFEAIARGAERKRFREFNTDRIDVVGYYTGTGDQRSYRIVATGDEGELQMEFDSKQMKWVK